MNQHIHDKEIPNDFPVSLTYKKVRLTIWRGSFITTDWDEEKEERRVTDIIRVSDWG